MLDYISGRNCFHVCLKSHRILVNFMVRKCSCGNCAETLLVNAREFRCSKKIVEAGGKFLFIGLNVSWIIPTLMQWQIRLFFVGPLMRNKNGKPYKVKNGAHRKFVATCWNHSYEIISKLCFRSKSCKLYIKLVK